MSPFIMINFDFPIRYKQTHTMLSAQEQSCLYPMQIKDLGRATVLVAAWRQIRDDWPNRRSQAMILVVVSVAEWYPPCN